MRYNLLLLFILMIYCSGCATKLPSLQGTYKSTCILQLYPSVILNLNKDSSFDYQLAYLKEKVTGTWTVNKDTIFLYSALFNEENSQQLTPKYKNTDLVNKDAYLLSKNKLFALSTNGIVESCFLKKAAR